MTGAKSRAAEDDRPPISIVLLADVKEGKSGSIAKAVDADRADELVDQKKARPATKTDFDFAGQ